MTPTAFAQRLLGSQVRLHHHALMLSSSLDMLAVDWRSERLVAELERIDGLGPPAERLELIRAELLAGA